MSDTHRALTDATIHHCWQQERWAHADFYFHMNPAERAKLSADGPCPWRGSMSPSVLSMINILEEMGEYAGPNLSVPANVS